MRNSQPCGVSEATAPIEASDRELLERYAGCRDASAFAALIRRHGPMVLGVCRRVLNHEQEAEDAFQATFLVLVRKASGIDRPELLGNWLYGVAYRVAHKARAQLARRRHHESSVEPMGTVEPHDDLVWQELCGLLDEELHQLPTKYRVPLVLCYLEGMTNDEAARQLGWPVGSMSYRLARGRQMLRERLRSRRKMAPGMFLLVLLRQHAGPQEVSPRLLDTTLRAAMDLSEPPELPVAPNAVPTEPSNATAAPGRPAFRWRRSILTVIALAAATASVATAGGVLYSSYGGFGNSSNEAVAPADLTPGALPTTVPVNCH
jgi:RNA polymerase sigma factor (sigma-70 family)